MLILHTTDALGHVSRRNQYFVRLPASEFINPVWTFNNTYQRGREGVTLQYSHTHTRTYNSGRPTAKSKRASAAEKDPK